MNHENYQDVIHQMQAFGIELREKDLPLKIDRAKRVTCGRKGKAWYWLQTFRPNAGGSYVVGRFGSYKTGDSCKVEVDWKPLSQAERDRMAAERIAAQEKATAAREQEARLAAMSACDLWREARREGRSAYLQRKRVEPEACRYLGDGSIVIPLLRYDRPRDEALVGTQRIWPDGRKRFTRGFPKTSASLRLGEILPFEMILVCEGYATGLTLRMATNRSHAVVVALDAYNLEPVCRMLRELQPKSPLLICADDDWRTEGNPGRDKARSIVKELDHCQAVWPSFAGVDRGEKDTDFNDLHVRAGLGRVHAQLRAAIDAIRRYRQAA